jgi:oxysterol-binding protein-related protein 9/10/11
MLALVKWYLTSFCAGLKMHPGKKPLTPIVGETFLCSWKVQEGKKPHLVHFVAEQVHNQPPGLLTTSENQAPHLKFYFAVTAFHVECPSKNISVSGYISFRCIFTGMSVDITVSGEMKLHLESYDESYEIGFPTVHARSIISKPCIQLGGKVNIQSSKNECSAVINYPKVGSFFRLKNQ